MMVGAGATAATSLRTQIHGQYWSTGSYEHFSAALQKQLALDIESNVGIEKSIGRDHSLAKLLDKFPDRYNTHGNHFEAICVVCQYQMEHDMPLYHVLIEDIISRFSFKCVLGAFWKMLSGFQKYLTGFWSRKNPKER